VVPSLPKKRAVVCFVEENDHLIQQMLALRRSWLHVDCPDSDLVVFGPRPVLARLPDDLVKIPQRPVADDPEWGGYRYANGMAYLNGPEAHRLDDYDHILHTDVDTFLAPGWKSFHPDGFTCGTGGYVNDQETRDKLQAVAAEFGLTHRGFSNAGPTWYGPPVLLRRTAAMAEMLTRYILSRHFRERPFTWPGWYWGVALLYGSEIAINHCIPNPQRTDLLDMVSTSAARATRDCVHIHCWHTDLDFSKHRFMAGGYRDTDPAALDLDVVPQYALAMSLASLADLGSPGLASPPPGSVVSSAAPAIVDADEAVRRLLQIQLGQRAAEEASDLLRGPAVDLAQAAEYHGVTNFIAPLIGDSKDGSAELRRSWKVLESRNRRAAEAQMACLNRLLDAFEAAGIAALVLKGRGLAQLIYDRPDLRPSVDIDLLVGRGDLRRAAGIARDQGFVFASEHGSRFAGRVHHLPAAKKKEAGFDISLELHDDALAPDSGGSITLARLTAPPRPFERAPGKTGLVLGHVDMLRHLTRHAFEPTARVRLKHLLDLWLYERRYAAEIAMIPPRKFQKTAAAMAMAELVLRGDLELGASPPPPDGLGEGMTPLSAIGAMPRDRQIDALFRPSEWWMRGYYGVPADASLLRQRLLDHPLTVARWLSRRGWVRLGFSDPNFVQGEA